MYIKEWRSKNKENHIVDTTKMVTAAEWLTKELQKQGFVLYELDIEQANPIT